MDTVYISVLDTVRTVGVTNWWNNPAWIGVLVALFGLLISWIVFNYTKKLNDLNQKAEINTRWVDLTDTRLEFWNCIDECYKIWHREVEKNNFRSIDIMALKAGLPHWLKPKMTPRYLKRSFENTLADSESHQQWMLRFCIRVFPSHDVGRSIFEDHINTFLKYGHDGFNRACSTLTHALNGWAETMPLKYLSQRFKGDFTLILVLVWLEISLFKKLGPRWSDRSSLFELALEIDKNIKKASRSNSLGV